MVKKFNITIEVESEEIEVSAENETDAKEAAYEAFTSDLSRFDCTFHIREIDSDDLPKVECSPLDEVIEVGQLEALRIIESRLPIGKYLYEEDLKFVAIDNRTGDAWTEEFDSKEEALAWLTNESLLAPSMRGMGEDVEELDLLYGDEPSGGETEAYDDGA